MFWHKRDGCKKKLKPGKRDIADATALSLLKPNSICLCRSLSSKLNEKGLKKCSLFHTSAHWACWGSWLKTPCKSVPPPPLSPPPPPPVPPLPRRPRRSVVRDQHREVNNQVSTNIRRSHGQGMRRTHLDPSIPSRRPPSNKPAQHFPPKP